METLKNVLDKLNRLGYTVKQNDINFYLYKHGKNVATVNLLFQMKAVDPGVPANEQKLIGKFADSSMADKKQLLKFKETN